MRIDIPCEVFSLDNGLRVIVHEDDSSPLAAVNVWYHVGSRNEQPGRTGLAHLFEHLMFEGSENVPTGQFDRLLEQAGAINNGSTTADRTAYWELLPANAVELALFLEADRMGGLLAALTQERFDAQRDVVMNERRESYENRPYGLAHERLLAALYPPAHPYHWPVIGFMHDLEATGLDDAISFCRTFYSPNNASLAVAGAVDTAMIRDMAERHFAPIRPAALPADSHPPAPVLSAEVRTVLEDTVQLPRLYIAWHSPPAFAPGDAEMDAIGSALAAGKASRLYRALVMGEKAIDVSAHQYGGQLGSTFEVTATARPGVGLAEIERIVRCEVESIARDGITDEELDRVRNGFATGFVDELQAVGGFGGRADRLNLYAHYLGDPRSVQADLERYLRLDPLDVATAADARLLAAGAVVLSVVPHGQAALAAAS